MTQDEQIRESLKTFVKTSASTLIGTVKTVDEQNVTISVDLSNSDDEAEHFLLDDVRLRATENGALGFYAIPKIGSKVFISRIGSSDEFVAVAFSEVDKVRIQNENRKFEVNTQTIVFNDNALGSFMPDINNLVDKINQLEQHVNDLKTVLKNWVPKPQDGGASLKTASATWANDAITETTVNDIKDATILN